MSVSDDGQIASLLGLLPVFAAVVSGPRHIVESANQAFADLVNSPRLIGEALPEALAQTGWSSFAEPVVQSYQSGAPILGWEIMAPVEAGRDGIPGRRWLEISYQPISKPGGGVSGVMITGVDITKSRDLEQELLRVKDELTRLQEIANYGIEYSLNPFCVIGRDGTFVDVNERVVEIWGYDRSLLIGRRAVDFIHPDDRARSLKAHSDVLAASKIYDFENRVVRNDGEEVPLLWSLMCSPDGSKIYATARDLTERRNAEEQVRRAYKTEMLGQLTGGIAHDFNNLLTIIAGNAELLSAEPSRAEQTEVLAAEIGEAAERGAQLTQRLLAFARRQPLKPSYLRVKSVLTELRPLIQRAVGPKITLKYELRDDDAWVIADVALLESAVLNLAVNANDAMPEGGTITIRSDARAALASEDPVAPGQDVVVVTVTDDGPGMPPEVLSRVFEPFFTTRGTGEGSGLGLSMVYGFAQQSGGAAKIESRLGEGTSVTLILPATPGLPAHGEYGSSAAARVIIVVNEVQRRRTLSARLLSFGHEVIEITNADDALAHLGRDGGFDLMLIDITPSAGISAAALAQKAARAASNLKVIVMGARDEFNACSLPERHRIAFLEKPYTRKQLAACVRTTMGEAVAAA